MDTSPDSPSQKKGLSGLAWLGIGCGGLVVLAVIAVVIFGVFFGPKLKQLGEDFVKDPTRATATTMVNLPGGAFEMAAQDEPGKRYTVREKASGKLTTIYWDAKQQKPVTIQGDFSAIPADANPPANPPAEPAPSAPSEPAPK